MSLARPIVRRVAAPFARGLTEPPLGGLEAFVRSLAPDVWYDPSDSSTLYQDSAGTTPVSAVEQPVGLMLDKSRGLVLGSELVVNGDFSNGKTGWSDTGGYTTTVSNGQLVFNGGTSTGGVYQSCMTVGKVYQITYTISSYTAGQFKIGAGTTFGPLRSAAGTYTEVRRAEGDGLFRVYGDATSFVGSIDNISVRELPGNHAYHTPGDTTTRPTYSRRINLLTKTEQFDDAAWGKNSFTVTANSTTAPDGALTADALFETAESNYHSIYTASTIVAAISGNSYTFKAYIKANGRTKGYLSVVRGGGYSLYDLVAKTNVFGGNGTNETVVSQTITELSDGWFLLTITSTFSGAANVKPVVGLNNDAGASTYLGDITKGIYLWGASLVPADLAALPYQRVNTATDYDASSVFPAYLRCDGTNDGMQTNSIDFSGTDKIFVSAGVRKLSDAATALIAELGTGSAGDFFLAAPRNSATADYAFRSRGTSISEAVSAASFAAPITSVLSGIGSISGDSVILRINGSQAASNTNDQGTGNYGNYKLYLFMRGGTSLPFNGQFFGSVIKGATLTAAQIALVERYLATKTKTVVLA